MITLVVASCGTTTGGTPVTTAAPMAGPVNAAMLDPGKFPTTPRPPAGVAGSQQAGRLVEGHLMAAYTVGPWQADPALTTRQSNDAAVIEDFQQLGTEVLWAWVAGAVNSLPFIVGFMSQRTSAARPHTSLRNAVLRFGDDHAATQAAHGIYDKAMSFPRVADSMPVVTEPEQAQPIPGHPDAHGALVTYQEGADRVQELIAATSHGPYVLVQVAHCGTDPACAAHLTSRTLDLQIPLIDTFTPTDPSQFHTLPMDPTGLVVRTLPLPPAEATSTSGASYPPAGALHLENDPVAIGAALTAAKVDTVSVNRSTVYQAATPDAAQQLLQAYGDSVAATPAAQAADGVPGLPRSRCTRVPGPGGLVPHYWCLATVGRYLFKTVARQLDLAHQQAAAQYRMLAP